MIEKIKKTYYIINASALFVLLVALTCYVCEKAHNERIRSYARLYDDTDFDKWEEE